jgi:hypothetical protein
MARKKHSETREARRFALILAIALAVLAGLALWRHHTTRAAWFAGAGAAIGLMSVAVFPLWLVLFRQWMKLALVLSWVMTRVILSVFFFVVLTPVGLVMRALGKAPLDLRWKDGKATYWIEKTSPESTIERYEKGY